MDKIRLEYSLAYSNYLNRFPKYEFHIASEIRMKYEVGDEFFSIAGNVVFADFRAVRLLVQKINSKRHVKDHLSAGQVNAAGLLDEIFHYIFRQYEIQVNPGVFKKALGHLFDNLGEENARKILSDFVSVFPTVEIFRGKSDIFEYLNSFTAGRSNLEITLEEMILLHFANFNPANKKILELFDVNYLGTKENFEKAISLMDGFFKQERKFGPDNQDIFDFLRTPILKNPDSLEAQLDFIRENWALLLDEKFIERMLTGKDLMKEEIWLGFGGGGAPTVVPQYKETAEGIDTLVLGKSGYKYAADAWKDYEEPEKFSRDIDWMPNVVLMAKNVYVWLDQLSKKYERPIKTLDQVPDEELDLLASWGFNGLWLIGIWERSSASRKIKHIMGNIDAVASAYSLFDYQIARDLGGEDAYRNLNERARRRGIRLASDMVPNHTGIFSKWVIEHPDYFIQSVHPPFPNYSFTGPDLSDDPSIQIRIEDGYWSRSDAAVVFQRIDNRTGEVRYIYHGNDGTNMPWNDTAQLNMIRKDVREAVIQKIFEVARKFSIIRFDAAMTLTKRHFSRLWYPPPGRGGDIPSRSDYAMSQAQFDILFPEEFWREVVDRINSEMPETLLLAEAFWLMEGYFVRTLGMHRVYNSAFMHMLMKEENAKYRDLISNTLEFEPEILKRYVNFMSNPDEETAIKQFGTDDKYFGVCTLMVTLPGLPMFAHGQVEGYSEKYGMEYQRAYYHEVPNQWLIDRHRREIFPLMKKRYLFSHVTNFWLYDFIDNFGNVNENLFAYSNSEFGERALVFYNNKYESVAGRIFRSSPKLVNVDYNTKELQTRTLAEALGINSSHNHFYIYREHVSGLEFLKSGYELSIQGFYIELDAFKYAVFLDFREVEDTTGDFAKLAQRIGGHGVPNVLRALKELKLEPIHDAFDKLFDGDTVEGLVDNVVGKEEGGIENKRTLIENNFSTLLLIIKNYFKLESDIGPVGHWFEEEIAAAEALNDALEKNFPLDNNNPNREIHNSIKISKGANYRENSILFMLMLAARGIKKLLSEEGGLNRSNFMNEMLLDSPIIKILHRLGRGETELHRELLLLKIILRYDEKIDLLFSRLADEALPNKVSAINAGKLFLLDLLNDEEVRLYIGVNEYRGIEYYSKENFEELIDWIYTIGSLSVFRIDGVSSADTNRLKRLQLLVAELKSLLSISERSEYKLGKLIELLSDKVSDKI